MNARKTYKYRLYRCDKRDKYLHQQIDIAGQIWNHAVALQRRYYRLTGGYIHRYDLQKHVAKLRKRRFTAWQQLDAQAAQDVIERLDKAYQRFFANPRQHGRPGFKKVHKYHSFTLKQCSWKLLHGNRIRIRGHVYKFVKHRELNGTIRTMTVKRDSANRLWLCFSVIEEIEPRREASTGQSGGFSFGLRAFLTSDDGRAWTHPGFLRPELHKLRQLNRSLSRKRKGSHNWEESRLELARFYAHVTNKRRDFHFKLAHALCDDYDVLCFESLNLDDMKCWWGSKITDLGFAQFIEITQQVAQKRGVEVRFVDYGEPTTPVCSVCGAQQQLELGERTFACGNCGVVLDRDHNAARNIKTAGTSAAG